MANGAVGKKGSTDAFANKAYGLVTMSAANTLTFSQIQMAVGIFQGVAMVIHRVLWLPRAAGLREIVAATDALYMALTTSNRLTSITDVAEPAIVAQRRIVGIGAGAEPFHQPFETDFTKLPGGGKIVSANPLYVALNSAGFAAAAVMDVELEFTFLELSKEDYLELIQAQFPANIA